MSENVNRLNAKLIRVEKERDEMRKQRDAMTAAVRDAGVLLATADPSSDLPDQEAADLWSTAVVNWLKQHEELIVTPPGRK